MSIKLFAFLAALGSAFADNTTTTTTDAATTTTTTAASGGNATTPTASAATTTTTAAASTATTTTTAATVHKVQVDTDTNMVLHSNVTDASLCADTQYTNASAHALAAASNLDPSTITVTACETSRRQLEESAEARQLQMVNKNVKTKFDITATDLADANSKKASVEAVTPAALKAAFEKTTSEMDFSQSSTFSSAPTINSAQAPTATVQVTGGPSPGASPGATTSGAMTTVVSSGAVLAAVALMM